MTDELSIDTKEITPWSGEGQTLRGTCKYDGRTIRICVTGFDKTESEVFMKKLSEFIKLEQVIKE